MSEKPLSQQKAVALKYPEGAEAPFVIAKGNGLLAKRILEEARENDIRIEENTPLVEFLSEIQVGRSWCGSDRGTQMVWQDYYCRTTGKK